MNILEYWQQIIALISFVAFVVRIEMLSKSNADRLKELEGRLDSNVTSDWVKFRTTSELKDKEHDDKLKQLFDFHNKMNNKES